MVKFKDFSECEKEGLGTHMIVNDISVEKFTPKNIKSVIIFHKIVNGKDVIEEFDEEAPKEFLKLCKENQNG